MCLLPRSNAAVNEEVPFMRAPHNLTAVKVNKLRSLTEFAVLASSHFTDDVVREYGVEEGRDKALVPAGWKFFSG